MRIRQRGGKVRQVGRGGNNPPLAPRIHPLPSAIDPGREWAVAEAGPGTVPHVYRDGKTNRIATPFDQSAASRQIRIHELGHVKWTPPSMRLEGLDPMTVNAAEDCRVHKRLREQSFDMSARILSDSDLEQFANRLLRGELPPIEAARMIAASINTGDAAGLNAAVSAAGLGWVVESVGELYDRHMRPRRPSWKRTIDFGRDLEGLFPVDGSDPVKSGPGDLSDAMDRATQRIRRRKSDPAKWGDMRTVTLPLSQSLPPRLRIKTRVATEYGAVPRNVHREVSDGRIFQRSRRIHGGGSVLIDLSGSMHLTPDQTLAILEAMPGVVVATYSGGVPDANTGTLRIVARQGRRVSDSDLYDQQDRFGGENIVDGPALDWLSRQPAPRYWVSDGMVTGAGPSRSPALVAEAARKCADGRIARVATAEALLGRVGQ